MYGAERSAISTLLSQAIAKLIPHAFEPLVGPPAGKAIKATGPLIAPGVELIDPKASYAQNLATVKQNGIPRFPLLTPVERQHETAFANDVEQNLEFFVEGAELAANDDALGTKVYEPDALKRLYAAYGTGTRPETAGERRVRAEANHALHPTATMVARLAFLKELDALAKLPANDPRRSVFATSGGCAAGKGDMDDAVRRQLGAFPFGAMWDSAGEGDGLENQWVLEAAQARGLKVVFGYAANDPGEQYRAVIERGQRTGRYVDVVTFAKSYLEGAKNMRALLESPAYLKAKADGTATTMAMYMGSYDRRAASDPKLPGYPEARLLGEAGLIEAAQVPAVPEAPEIIASALRTLTAMTREVREAGGDVDGMLLATLGTAEKFVRAGALK